MLRGFRVWMRVSGCRQVVAVAMVTVHDTVQFVISISSHFRQNKPIEQPNTRDSHRLFLLEINRSRH